MGRLTDVVVGLSLLLAVLKMTSSFRLFSDQVVVDALPAVAVITASSSAQLFTEASRPATHRLRARPIESFAAGSSPWRAARNVAIVALARARGADCTERMNDLDTIRCHGPVPRRARSDAASSASSARPPQKPLLPAGRRVAQRVRDPAVLSRPPRRAAGECSDGSRCALLAAWCAGGQLGTSARRWPETSALCSTPARLDRGGLGEEAALPRWRWCWAAGTLLVHSCRATRVPRTSAATSSQAPPRDWPIGTKLRHDGAPVVARRRSMLVDTSPRDPAPLLADRPSAVDRCVADLPQRRARRCTAPCSRSPSASWLRLPAARCRSTMRSGSQLGCPRHEFVFRPTRIPDLQKSIGSRWPLLMVGGTGFGLLAALGGGGGAGRSISLVGVRDARRLRQAYVFTPWSAAHPMKKKSLCSAVDLRVPRARARTRPRSAAASQPLQALSASSTSAIVILSNKSKRQDDEPAADVHDAAGVCNHRHRPRWSYESARAPSHDAPGPGEVAVTSPLPRSCSASPSSGRSCHTSVPRQSVHGRRDELRRRHLRDVPAPCSTTCRRRRLRALDSPLFGETLTDHVRCMGVERSPTVRSAAPAPVGRWLSSWRPGRYDYVVVSTSPATVHPQEPAEIYWTNAPGRDAGAATRRHFRVPSSTASWIAATCHLADRATTLVVVSFAPPAAGTVKAGSARSVKWYTGIEASSTSTGQYARPREFVALIRGEVRRGSATHPVSAAASAPRSRVSRQRVDSGPACRRRDQDDGPWPSTSAAAGYDSSQSRLESVAT